MDLLMFAADAVFSVNKEEDLSIPLTPTKGTRPVFGEITNTVNISPEKFSNSPLQTLFTAPTLSTPKTKSRSLASAVTTPGSRGIIGRGSNGKSLSYPSPGREMRTPGSDVVSPHLTTSGGSGKSPLTPMSNLKLLTRIASMEESLTSKKVLFQNQSVKEKDGKSLSNMESLLTDSATVKNVSSLRRHNSNCLKESQSKIQINKPTSTLCKLPTSRDYSIPSSPGNLVIEDVGHLPSMDETTTNRSSEGSRKDKSLGLLSEKFLEYFPMEVSYLETPRRLVIDEVASMLGTERRRVYDIINVLESLNMATRVQKNMYQWMGKLHLEETLGRLKALGHKLNVGAHLQALQNLNHDFKVPQRIKTTNDGERADTRREKSLGILCQKFLMLLLVSPEPHIISLDSAVRMLVGEAGEDNERLRTRGRRLYDIANVLTSLGLVKRVPTAKAFQYIGPKIEAVTSEEDTLGVLHRHSLLPSRLGSSTCKENTSFGDHDVTPSNVAPPVQKRGRPRKLSTDFSASALPAAKRSRLQRTRSEDITTSKQTRKFTRHPSLHDICQVAEMEREKLLQKEQQQFSYSNSESTYRRSSSLSSLKKQLQNPTMNTEVQPVNSIASVANLLRSRLASHGKMPVALTFQGCRSHWVQEGQSSAQPEIEERSITLLGLTSPSAGQQTSSFSHQNSEVYRAMHHEVRKELTSQRSFPNSELSYKSVQPVNQFFCTSGQEFQATPVMMVKSGCTMLTGHQHGSHGATVGPTASKNTRVIKVITKTGGSSQQESSTVITVLPATQTTCNQSSALTKQFVVQASGGFQQVSPGTYTNGHKVTGSNGSTIEGATFPESKQGNLSPYSIYTVSNNQMGHRAYAKISCPKSVISCTLKDSPEPKSCDSLSINQLPLPQVLQTQATTSGTRFTSSSVGLPPNTATGPRSFLVCNKNSSRQWQPSPDGSSTDSELEEIFGNAFNYTRPKSLVSKNSRESGPPVDKK